MSNEYARLDCRSGFCAKVEGYSFDEVRDVFLPDGLLICHDCRIVEIAMKRKAAEEHAIYLKQVAHIELLKIEERKQARKQEFIERVGDLSLGSTILASAESWTDGRQHLHDNFYVCPICREPKEDPFNFSLIYSAGKQPLFNGYTKCDFCFQQSLVF